MSAAPAFAPHTFLNAVREAVRLGRHTDAQSLAALLSQAESLLRAPQSVQGQTDVSATESALRDRDISDFAHIIATVMHVSAEEGLHRSCLSLLCSLGETGEAYALSYLVSGQARSDVLAGMVQSMPPARRLLLLNALFRRPRALPDMALDSLRRGFTETINDDPEEGLVLLDTLRKRGGHPACVVQHAMLGSRFGLWMEELLRMELNAEQIAYMADAIRVLQAPGLAAMLVRHVRRMRGAAMVPILRCFGACADPADDTVRDILLKAAEHALPAVHVAALEALALLGIPDVAEPLAVRLGRDGPTPTLCMLLLRLDAEMLKQVFRLLDSAKRPQVVARLAAVLGAFDQKGMLSLLQDLELPASRATSPAEAAAHARAFLAAHGGIVFTPFYVPPAPRTEPDYAEPEDDAGGLLSSVRSLFSREAKQESGPHPLGQIKAGDQVRGQTFGPGNLPALTLDGVVFTECIFTNTDISFSALSQVRFEKCRLHGVRLTESRLSDVVFIDCELALAMANGCLMDAVRFEGTLLDAVDVSESHFSACRFDNATLRTVRLWGSQWERCVWTNCIVECSDLGYVTMRESDISGSLFGDCVFARAELRDVQAVSALFSGCVASLCRASELDTLEPFLLDMEEEWCRTALIALAEDMAERALLPVNAAVYMLLQRWLEVADAGHRARRMLSQNRRRLDWCRAKLGRRGDMILLVPLLLQSATVPTPEGAIGGAPCVIRGYQPNRATQDAAQRRFAVPFVVPPTAALSVEAVYLSGAAGSIAQTAGSPLEVWVLHECPDNGETAALLEAFREKLKCISHWAQQELQLTVRFQLFHSADIRQNRFGFDSSEGAEGAGISQSLLLKAELYRFAILLAGRMPAWWLTPAGLSEAGYAQHLVAIARATGAAPPLDLGALESISREAMLSCLFWYIARALSIPFLSLLVFGQLEAALSTAGGTPGLNDDNGLSELLCNRIKRRLHAGFCGLWHADPLAVPLRDMFAFYQAQGSLDVLDLIRQAFARKCGYATLVATATARTAETLHLGAEFVEYFIPFSEDAVGRKLADPIMQGDDTLPTLLEMSELGERLNAYLLATYVRVRERLGVPHAAGGHGQEHNDTAELPSGSGLSERDMTMAGRKIFAWLEPRPYKVMRLPFIEPPYRFIDGLEFQCDLSPTQTPVWKVQARLPKLPGQKAARELLRTERSPIKLISWLLANEYWQPGVHISGSSLAPHVGIADVQDALTLLGAICSPQAFDRPWEEYLEQEAVVRVDALINFATVRDARSVETVSLLYLTNWGELFCLPDVPGAVAFADRALAAVRSLAHCPVAPGAVLTLHTPRRFSFELEQTMTF